MESSHPETQLFINGVWRNSSNGSRLEILDPATDEIVGYVSSAAIPDLDEALAASSAGFDMWKATPAIDRSGIMRRAAAHLRESAETTAVHMTTEQGKPLAESRMEVMAAAEIIEWFAEEARRSYGRLIPARAAGVTQMAMKEPVGPVAAFTPWNFPINQTVRKLSAALAAGCSIIIKGPEETPAAPAALVRAFEKAGIPAGVVGLVYGDPAMISEHLIASPIIRKISFTGSTAVGKHLAALAGRHMKKTTMELGGHGPCIICADTDVKAAADLLARAKFRNAGQVCISPTRFLVEAPVFDEFLDHMTKAAKSIKVGSGLEEGVQMGPLANRRRVSAIEELLADAVALGANITAGGARIGSKGNFFAPTVIANVPASARIMNEEPFGPVAIINPAASLDDAIAEANRLPYGLASYGFARSARSIERLGLEIVTGMTSINHIGLGLAETPFGGVRDSGYGSEGGSEAIGDYQVTRFVTQRAV